MKLNLVLETLSAMQQQLDTITPSTDVVAATGHPHVSEVSTVGFSDSPELRRGEIDAPVMNGPGSMSVMSDSEHPSFSFRREVQENEEKGSEAGSLSAVNFSAVSHNGQASLNLSDSLSFRMMMIAFITFKSSLVPLFEGL